MDRLVSWIEASEMTAARMWNDCHWYDETHMIHVGDQITCVNGKLETEDLIEDAGQQYSSLCPPNIPKLASGDLLMRKV